MTQAELARGAGLPPATISHFETGERTPSTRNLERIANALEVSVDFLLGRAADRTAMSPKIRGLLRSAGEMDDESLSVLQDFSEMLARKARDRRKKSDDDTQS